MDFSIWFTRVLPRWAAEVRTGQVGTCQASFPLPNFRGFSSTSLQLLQLTGTLILTISAALLFHGAVFFFFFLEVLTARMQILPTCWLFTVVLADRAQAHGC